MLYSHHQSEEMKVNKFKKYEYIVTYTQDSYKNFLSNKLNIVNDNDRVNINIKCSQKYGKHHIKLIKIG